MTITYEETRRVEFADTDMAGMAHFTSFLHFMEEAEYAFLRSLGLSVMLGDEKGTIGFPRVSVQCNYHRPMRFEEVVLVRLRVVRNDGKLLTHGFEVVRGDTLLADGQITVACCRFPQDGSDPYAIPLPQFVLDKIPVVTSSSGKRAGP